jgi:hypothetical protein
MISEAIARGWFRRDHWKKGPDGPRYLSLVARIATERSGNAGQQDVCDVMVS